MPDPARSARRHIATLLVQTWAWARATFAALSSPIPATTRELADSRRIRRVLHGSKRQPATSNTSAHLSFGLSAFHPGDPATYGWFPAYGPPVRAIDGALRYTARPVLSSFHTG